jgi:hypothetical protein
MDLNGVVTLKIIPTWFDKDNKGNVVWQTFQNDKRGKPNSTQVCNLENAAKLVHMEKKNS